MNYEAVKTILPEQNKEDWNGNRDVIIKLKNFGNMFSHPFSVFLDFESTLENQESKQIDNELTKTNTLQKHIVNSCGLKYKCIHEKYSKPIKIINNSTHEKVLQINNRTY